MGKKHPEAELNRVEIPLAVFMESYNRTIPAHFPHVSVKALKRFQATHPLLFKDGGGWSVDKHRKRLMDWLSSYRDES